MKTTNLIVGNTSAESEVQLYNKEICNLLGESCFILKLWYFIVILAYLFIFAELPFAAGQVWQGPEKFWTCTNNAATPGTNNTYVIYSVNQGKYPKVCWS